MTLIIAEVGVNHNGHLADALRLTNAAKTIGADIVKFQLYQPKLLAKSSDHLAMLTRYLLKREQYPYLSRLCDRIKIGFACTAFDVDSLEFLLSECNMRLIKIASPSIKNIPLLERAAKSDLPIVLSTANATHAELITACDIFKHNKLTLLHCVSDYPTEPEKANLRRMDDLMRYHTCIGLSDHSGEIFASLAAVARGAKVIECHFTSDKKRPGPDHLASLDVGQFAQMVQGVRFIRAAL